MQVATYTIFANVIPAKEAVSNAGITAQFIVGPLQAKSLFGSST
jgi:hypothetical protein